MPRPIGTTAGLVDAELQLFRLKTSVHGLEGRDSTQRDRYQRLACLLRAFAMAEDLTEKCK